MNIQPQPQAKSCRSYAFEAIITISAIHTNTSHKWFVKFVNMVLPFFFLAHTIPLLLMAYKTAIHEITGCTPAQLMMGCDLRLPIDLLIG